MGKIIGIDLGTTNSVVAIMVGREPKVIVNEEGSLITPSVVAWDDKGGVLVVQIAKRQAVTKLSAAAARRRAKCAFEGRNPFPPEEDQPRWPKYLAGEPALSAAVLGARRSRALNKKQVGGQVEKAAGHEHRELGPLIPASWWQTLEKPSRLTSRACVIP